MADKEASVFIVDVGRSMAAKSHDRELSDLEWSMQFVWDKITNIVSLNRKTLIVGILGLGTDESNNAMADDGYDHISVLQEMTPMGMQELRELAPRFSASKTEKRDALSAVILAIDMIMRYCKHLQYKKRITLVTNGNSPIDEDDIATIAEQISSNNIELTVLGVDFDDPEYGFKEEDKPVTKQKNEVLLKSLVDQTGGKFATMQEAIEGLAVPFIKPVKPTPTYKGQLCLGDPENYETAIGIDIERYFKVAVKRPPTASSFVIARDSSHENQTQDIEHIRKYRVDDPEHPGGKQDVSREELAKGYEYGRTAVHIAESEENITKLETFASYHILGFLPRENTERYLVLDNTNMLVAQRGNAKAALALSSLIHALFEMDSCAIGRLVKKDMSEPQLTLLTPLVQEDIEYLTENILPFAEDLRQYRFPPVDKVVTVSGKSLASHRNLPSDDLVEAMSDLVDSMSLMHDDYEQRPIEDTYSPVNYSVESAIKYRAVHPGKEVPPIPEAFLSISKIPEDVLEQSKQSLERVIKAADVKKVPPKVKGRKKYREPDKPLSGLNVEDLFRKEKRTKISPDNAIPEFRQAFAAAEQETVFTEAVDQMASIVRNQIKNSFGNNNYDRVVEMLGAVRQELIEYEKPALFNDLIRRLKKEILSEALGGNRKEMWWKVKVSGLGLIDQDQSEISDVTKSEASEFLYSK